MCVRKVADGGLNFLLFTSWLFNFSPSQCGANLRTTAIVSFITLSASSCLARNVATPEKKNIYIYIYI